jgi:chromosome segregation ATPase
MTDNAEVTITIPVKQATQGHIERLQQKLAERNATIERLRADIDELKTSGINQEERAREFERGWKACANHLADSTQRLAQELRRVRKDATDIYYGYKEDNA